MAQRGGRRMANLEALHDTLFSTLLTHSGNLVQLWTISNNQAIQDWVLSINYRLLSYAWYNINKC